MNGPPPPIDWSAGRYETFADQLAPIAEHVIALAAPAANETLLDVACGTGNATLRAARRGANATGLDMAARLIEVAAAQAADEGLPASFVVGDAQALPFDDDTFDVVVSVMGIIFARDGDIALGEVMHVMRPGGRAFVSAWLGGGAVDAMVRMLMSGITEVLGPARPRLPWFDTEAVHAFAAEAGATARFHAGELVFTAESPETFLAEQERDHPTSRWAAQAFAERNADGGPMYERALAALREHNEDPAAFRATSRYHVIELRHA